MASNPLVNVIDLHEKPEFRTASCEAHGDFEQRITKILGKDFSSICPQCSSERKAKQEEEERQARARMAAHRLSERLGAAMIPPRFAGKSFDDYLAESDKQKKALSACMDYAARFPEHAKAGRCLLMFGKPGTGKTHLAAAIANDAISSGDTAVYRTVGGIIQSIKATYDHSSGKTEAEVMAAMVDADLLVIDEVGATKTTEFELAVLFAIVNGRYENVRPTIIVSNLMPDELPAAMGERCVDRLREGGGIALIFDWSSARAKVKA